MDGKKGKQAIYIKEGSILRGKEADDVIEQIKSDEKRGKEENNSEVYIKEGIILKGKEADEELIKRDVEELRKEHMPALRKDRPITLREKNDTTQTERESSGPTEDQKKIAILMYLTLKQRKIPILVHLMELKSEKPLSDTEKTLLNS